MGRTRPRVKPGAGRRGSATRIVIDADALTLIARKIPTLFAALQRKLASSLRTRGEFARLFPDIAEKFGQPPPPRAPPIPRSMPHVRPRSGQGAWFCYKGPDTVIADPQGRCSINSAHYDRAAPWLATAGSGDVLAGFIAGLLARGFSTHGRRRNRRLVACRMRAFLSVPGLIAEDLPEELPKVFRALGAMTSKAREPAPGQRASSQDRSVQRGGQRLVHGIAAQFDAFGIDDLGPVEEDFVKPQAFHLGQRDELAIHQPRQGHHRLGRAVQRGRPPVAYQNVHVGGQSQILFGAVVSQGRCGDAHRGTRIPVDADGTDNRHARPRHHPVSGFQEVDRQIAVARGQDRSRSETLRFRRPFAPPPQRPRPVHARPPSDLPDWSVHYVGCIVAKLRHNRVDCCGGGRPKLFPSHPSYPLC